MKSLFRISLFSILTLVCICFSASFLAADDGVFDFRIDGTKVVFGAGIAVEFNGPPEKLDAEFDPLLGEVISFVYSCNGAIQSCSLAKNSDPPTTREQEYESLERVLRGIGESMNLAMLEKNRIVTNGLSAVAARAELDINGRTFQIFYKLYFVEGSMLVLQVFCLGGGSGEYLEFLESAVPAAASEDRK